MIDKVIVPSGADLLYVAEKDGFVLGIVDINEDAKTNWTECRYNLRIWLDCYNERVAKQNKDLDEHVEQVKSIKADLVKISEGEPPIGIKEYLSKEGLSNKGYSIGEVVKLRSGGPKMTIVRFSETDMTGRAVHCSWFEDNKKQEQGVYPEKALVYAVAVSELN